MTEFYYKEISESEVDRSKLGEAMRVLSYCKKALENLPDIKIQWCKRVDEARYELDGSLVKLQVSLDRLAGRKSNLRGKYHAEDRPFFGQCYGLTGSREKARLVLLRADIPLDQIGLTVAHECFHLHEFGPLGKYRPPITAVENRGAEKRAENFAVETIKKLGVPVLEEGITEALGKFTKELRRLREIL